jgi:hypothetical protein
MISVDTTGLVRVWPYSMDHFSGFGWFVPERTYRLDRTALVIMPLATDTAGEDILFNAPEDAELKRASAQYTSSAAFLRIRSTVLQPKPYDTEVHVSAGASAVYVAAQRQLAAQSNRSGGRPDTTASTVSSLAPSAAAQASGYSGYSYSHTYLPLYVPGEPSSDGRNRLHTLTYTASGLLRRHVIEPYQLLRVTGELVSASLSARRRDLLCLIAFPYGFNCGLELGFLNATGSTERGAEEATAAAAGNSAASAGDFKAEKKTRGGGKSGGDVGSPLEVALENDAFRQRRLRARGKAATEGRGSGFARVRTLQLVANPSAVTRDPVSGKYSRASGTSAQTASHLFVATDVAVDLELASPKQRPSFAAPVAALDTPPSDYVYLRSGDPDPQRDVIAVFSLTTGQRVAVFDARVLAMPATGAVTKAGATSAVGAAPAIGSWDVLRDQRWFVTTSLTSGGGGVLNAYRIVTDDAPTNPSAPTAVSWNTLVATAPDAVPRWCSYSVEERIRRANRNMACGKLTPSPAARVASDTALDSGGAAPVVSSKGAVRLNQFANVHAHCRDIALGVIAAAVRVGAARVQKARATASYP